MNARKKVHHDGHNHDDEMRITASLRERGYRITLPRKKIIEALATAATAKSAREIGERTNIKDASTVYRTLSELVKEELIEEFTDKGVTYFEIAHHHHDHAICDTCGTVEHIPCQSVLIPRPLTQKGWEVTKHESVYHGQCGACTKTSS
jgi:Fe2+ or Zn2+ uptake regulation protein